MSEGDKNLDSFLSRVQDLYKPVTGGLGVTGYDKDFQELKKLSTGLKQSDADEHKSLAGQKPENRKKNRYKDITPFDNTRVKLTVTNDDPSSDYINASFIKGAEGHPNYIASQGPLPHTLLDFWQMLWQYNVSVIVMVCREIELGKKKCERYWADQEDPKNFGGITVSLTDKQDLKDGYCLRTIKAQKGSEIRYIQQFHYVSWPDHGVPKTCFEIITLINHIRDVQSYSKDETTPLCVHCSAGCGRTGAVLAVDYVRNLLVNKTVPPTLKMYDIIAEMRRQRPAIVQTKDQYEFVNVAIAEMFLIYKQTRTVSFQGFSVGYEGEQYVNVNIQKEEKSKDKSNGVGPKRPTTLTPSYENVEIRNRPKIDMNAASMHAARLNSFEEYPDNSPPPKPIRPVSVLLPANNSSVQYGHLSDRKQSAPVITLPQKGDGKLFSSAVSSPLKSPTAKPRSSNIKNSIALLTAPSRPRTASGSPSPPGKDAAKPQPPPGKPKPKPDPAPKNFSGAPPPKSPGNIVPPVSPLHGKSAPHLCSPNKVKSNFSSPLTPTYGNISPPTKKEAPLPPMKPPLKKPSTKRKSPVHERVEKFEKTDTTVDTKITAPRTSPRKQKPKEIVLKITEQGDAPSDVSETDSPEAKENFVIPNSEKPKSLLPPVSPKPKVAIKPPMQGITNGPRSSEGQQNLRDIVLRNGVKAKPQPTRPLSQNLSSSSLLPNSKQTRISTSTLDLSTEGKKAPPPVAQKSFIVRSSSVSGVNSEDGEKTSFHAMRAKFQIAKAENNNRGAKTDLNSKDAQVEVISFTQADGSYGPIFAATTKSKQSEGRITSPLQRKGSNYQIQTPAPFKSQSRLSISKLGPFKVSGSPKKTAGPAYENTDIKLNSDDRQPLVLSPEATAAISQTLQCDSLDGPNSDADQDYANVPPRAPPQSSKPKLGHAHSAPSATGMEVQETHGFVSRTSDQGAAPKPVVTAKPKFVEELKKKPTKPKRTSRPQTSEGSARTPSPPSSANIVTVQNNFQKYEKKNVYSDVEIIENNENRHLVVESEYEGILGDGIIPRSSSNTSMDRSSPSSRASTPPKLPSRTPESQMFLSEAPPMLPMRTSESYLTIEDGDDFQPYEVADAKTSTLPPPSPKSFHEETDRRPSATSTTGTSLAPGGLLAAKAKAKNMFEKTTNAISKVGASITKTNDDDSSGSAPSTLENRTPTYVPGPVVYGGQDMSFGKRLLRKVRGGRKLN